MRLFKPYKKVSTTIASIYRYRGLLLLLFKPYKKVSTTINRSCLCLPHQLFKPYKKVSTTMRLDEFRMMY
nr:MAG TPA: hypothetical protein [Bacteriophage sp.]